MKPHDQVQFIRRTLLFVGILTLCRVYSQCILSPAERASIILSIIYMQPVFNYMQLVLKNIIVNYLLQENIVIFSCAVS